jgi:hypothetical protein
MSGALWILIGIYVLGLPADYLASRRFRIRRRSAALIAPAWPVVLLSNLLIRAGRK